jgi:hypothetical protein
MSSDEKAQLVSGLSALFAEAIRKLRIGRNKRTSIPMLSFVCGYYR